MALADRLVITRVHLRPQGDTDVSRHRPGDSGEETERSEHRPARTTTPASPIVDISSGAGLAAGEWRNDGWQGRALLAPHDRSARCNAAGTLPYNRSQFDNRAALRAASEEISDAVE